MPPPATIDEICAALTARGWPALARRLAYFASAEDLEPGDVPLTVESALGFWAFFSVVESDTRVEIGCSPEGWICADWRFADARTTTIWFLDEERVRFAAKDAAGRWVDMDGGGDAGGLKELASKLVEAGLFTWQQNYPVNGNSIPDITLPDTAGVAT